jgi:hypothetical protein
MCWFPPDSGSVVVACSPPARPGSVTCSTTARAARADGLTDHGQVHGVNPVHLVGVGVGVGAGDAGRELRAGQQPVDAGVAADEARLAGRCGLAGAHGFSSGLSSQPLTAGVRAGMAAGWVPVGWAGGWLAG